MKGRLRGANKSVQDLNCKYFHFFCGHAATQDVEPLWWATYDWPLAKLEKLGPWAQRQLLGPYTITFCKPRATKPGAGGDRVTGRDRNVIQPARPSAVLITLYTTMYSMLLAFLICIAERSTFLQLYTFLIV